MRSLRHVLSGLFVVAAVAAHAQVLPGSDRLDLLHRGAFMLVDARVQKKVGLSESQIEKVTKLISEHSAKTTALVQLSPPSVEAMNGAEDQASGEILGVLTDPQKEDLKKAALNAGGYPLMLSDEVASDLKLTADQKRKIGQILDDAGLPVEKLDDIIGRKVRENPKKSRETIQLYAPERARLVKQRKADEAKALTVLTESQLATWKKMSG